MKKLIVVFIVVVLVVVTGCSATSGEKEYREGKIDTLLNVYPKGSSYAAQCKISPKNEIEEEINFEDMKIKVNGRALNLVAISEENDYCGIFQREGFDIEEGELVSIYIDYNLYKEVKEAIEVPAPVTSKIEVSTDITNWVSGEADSITLAWQPSNADWYSVTGIRYYEENGEYTRAGYFSSSTSKTEYTFSDRSRLEYEEERKADKVDFQITAVNKCDVFTDNHSALLEVAAPVSKQVTD
jgi:hypothetical protein